MSKKIITFISALGDCTFINSYSKPVTAVYTQMSSVTNSASFSDAMSVSAEAEAKVLSFVKTKAGITGSVSATVSSGTTYSQSASGSTTVDPGERLNITAYMGGVYAQGTAYADVVWIANGIILESDKALGVGDMVVNANSITLVYQ